MILSRRLKPKLRLPLVLLVLSNAPLARAEDPAGAEALFREGRALFAEGKVEAACLKLKASQDLDASPGTLLNLAACHAAAGKTATAWAEFVAAGRLAHSERKDRQEAEAKRRAAELESTLSYLTVRVPDAVPGLEIRRAGELLEPSIYGMRVPVDPGVQVLDVSAPGYQPWHLEVRLAPRNADEVVDVPKLTPRPAGVTPTAAPLLASKPSRGAPTPTPVFAPVPSESPRSTRALPWVVGGLGGAFLLTGAVAGTLALRSNSAAKELCPDPHHCDDEQARSLADRRDTEALIANIGVGAGLAGVGLAVVLLFTSNSSDSSSSAAHVLFPALSPHHAGVTWMERF